MGEIKITTKYNIGDKFFCAFNIKKKCPYCKRFHPHYVVAEVEITDIGFYSGSSAYYSVTVYVDKNMRFSTSYVNGWEFCKTREEAQKRCDIANMEYLTASVNFLNNDMRYGYFK